MLLLAGCTPSTIDTLTNDPSEVARWLQAGERIYRATGISWSPSLAPCTGPGCAYTVDKFEKPNKVGDGSTDKFRARVLEGMDEDQDEQVKVHELMHTMLVMHVTSESVMNPIARPEYDCISEAELWQLCHIMEGRCSRQVPECSVPAGWKVILPGGREVNPVLWEARIKAGKTFVELLLEATDAIQE